MGEFERTQPREDATWAICGAREEEDAMMRLPLGRVLVVDDEDDIRNMLAIVLAAEGWQVDEAAGGEEALARCEAEEHDVVVLDLRMPGMSGLDVAHRLAEREYDTHMVLFSAYVDSAVERECEELGVAVVDKVDWYGLVDVCRSAMPARAA
jgi:CheY-like chemotaxis protein